MFHIIFLYSIYYLVIFNVYNVLVFRNLILKREYYLIEGFMSLKIFAVVFLIVISRAVCEDDKNITITKFYNCFFVKSMG